MNEIKQLRDIVDRDAKHECAGFGKHALCVRAVAVAALPTRFGDFRIVAFWNNRDEKEHVAIIRGDVVGHSDVPMRVHSECLTGDALGSVRCDCRDQLEAALKRISVLGEGLVLYLRQEGRGRDRERRQGGCGRGAAGGAAGDAARSWQGRDSRQHGGTQAVAPVCEDQGDCGGIKFFDNCASLAG